MEEESESEIWKVELFPVCVECKYPSLLMVSKHSIGSFWMSANKVYE